LAVRGRLANLALIGDAPFTGGELMLATGLLWLVGAGVFLSPVIHGGLYADDWSRGAVYRFPTQGHLSDFTSIDPRPVHALYLLLTFAVLGLHARAQLSVAIALGLLASTAFYALLRSLGVDRLLAWLLAVMALLFPNSDATKLWPAASAGMLSVTFCCAGLLLALHALRDRGRRALALHLGASVLYALSIMTYETAAPLIAISAPLLVWWDPRLRAGARASRRTVVRRTVADVVMVALILKFVIARTPKGVYLSVGSLESHLSAIVGQGLLVFSQSLFPFYSVAERRLTTSLAVAIIAAGCFVWSRLPRGGEDRALLGRGLGMTAAGLIVTAACWAILVPSNIVYSPAAGGDGTRINDAAAFGIVITVLGLLLICAALVFRGLPGGRRLGGVAAAALTSVVAVGYGYRIGQDIGRWDGAARTRTQVLAAVHAQLPRLPQGAHVYATGYVEEPYGNIGSFDFPWDLNGALEVTYDDRTVVGDPVMTPSDLHCGPGLLTPLVGPPQAPNTDVPYGSAVYLVSVAPRFVRRISSRSACLAAGGTAAG
jgi:hypothetical protein